MRSVLLASPFYSKAWKIFLKIAQHHISKLRSEPRFQQLSSSPNSQRHEDKVRNSDFHLAGPLDRFRQKATGSDLHFIIILAAMWRMISRNKTGGRDTS